MPTAKPMSMTSDVDAVAARRPHAPARLDLVAARLLPVHPNVVSLLKAFLVTPLMVLALKRVDVLPTTAWMVTLLFVAFVLCDVLDGMLARGRYLRTGAGRLIDLFTDYPMAFVVAVSCLDVLPRELVAGKLAIDALMLVVFFWLFVVKGKSVRSRVHVTLGEVTLLAMLLLSQGHMSAFVRVDVVATMLFCNTVFSALAALALVGVLQLRFVADALSFANALCGVASIWFAAHHQPHVCLLLLLVGAGFDGLDGAAARRWGGTWFGVYSDDIADGINYAIAPGVALAYCLSGWEGTAVGVAFSALTLSRLVFFTLNKSSSSDPNYFSGMPSTIGGIVVLCAVILFPEQHALVGLMVGVSVALMVSFDSAYRHLGRALFAARKSRVALAVACGVVLVAGATLAGPRIPVAVVLAGCLVYGFLPQLLRFVAVLRRDAR